MKLSIKEIIKRIKILEDELIVLNQEEDIFKRWKNWKILIWFW